MKTKEIVKKFVEMKPVEVEKETESRRSELAILKLQVAAKKVNKHAEIRMQKRNIARLLTIKNSRKESRNG